MDRHLTHAETQLLKPIFRDMLPYAGIVCKTNRHNVGGALNSITPSGTPYFSKYVYSTDFSKATPDNQWVFIHELTHVWQWWHGVYPIWSAIGIFLEKAGDYLKAYPYTLTPGKKFLDFNMEQQAAIVADYWAVTSKLMRPINNNDPKTSAVDYVDVISQFQGSGPPVSKLDDDPMGGGGRKRDW